MKRLILIIMLIVGGTMIIVSGQLYFSNRTLSASVESMKSRLGNLKEESLNLKSDLEYLKFPENLEKELRSRFNYKNPGEKLIIVVPSNQSSTTQ